jgi:nitrate/nitrite transporter NarK
MTEIFVGAAILYAVGFTLLCFRVKEGEYPPPPKYVDGQQGFIAGLKTYCVECFSLRYYWFIFGMETFWAVAACVGIFNLFFIEEIGLTLKQYGHIAACGGFVGMLLTYPAGMVADKYHPLRVEFIMMLIMVLLGPLNLAYLFIKMSPQTVYYYYFAVMLIGLPAGTLYGAATLPAIMHLFPKDRFGQFSSAQAMVRSFGTIVGGLIAGGTFDLLKWIYDGSNFAYRWVPAWSWCFQILAFICLVNVYRGWKYYGGLKDYVPPLPEKRPLNAEQEKVFTADENLQLQMAFPECATITEKYEDKKNEHC